MSGPRPEARANGAHEDPASAPTTVIGIVAVTLLVATILVIFIIFNRNLEQEQSRKANVPRAELDRYRSEQAELLTSYDWVDKDGRIVSIPIERAMKIVAAELNETAAVH